MKRYLRIPLATLTLAVLAIGTLRAGPITVDGSWSDWGIDPYSGDWNASQGQRIFYENYLGGDGTAYLSPGWGGQFFDVEAIYACMQGSTVCFAIVTGFDPDGVLYDGDVYRPGDIFLDVGSGWNVGIDLETAKVYTGAGGSVPYFGSSAPYTIIGGTYIGTTLLSVPLDGVKSVYHQGDSSSHHYLFEGCLDLGSVGGLGSDDVGLHWTMSCGNDIGEGYLPKPSVPEPATLCLLGLGGVAAAWTRRRSRR